MRKENRTNSDGDVGGVREKANTQKKYLTVRMIKNALEKEAGQVSGAAKRLKVTFSAIYYHIKKNPALRLIAKRVEEEALDLAEGNLVTALEEGKRWATEYMLNKKGKSRGYMDSSEVIIPSVPITFDYQLVTPESLKKQRDEENKEKNQDQPTMQ